MELVFKYTVKKYEGDRITTKDCVASIALSDDMATQACGFDPYSLDFYEVVPSIIHLADYVIAGGNTQDIINSLEDIQEV